MLCCLSFKMGVCGGCGALAADKRCGKCQLAFYCSAECQRKDWKQHKRVCNETGAFAATRAPTAANSALDILQSMQSAESSSRPFDERLCKVFVAAATAACLGGLPRKELKALSGDVEELLLRGARPDVSNAVSSWAGAVYHACPLLEATFTFSFLAASSGAHAEDNQWGSRWPSTRCMDGKTPARG